MKADSLPDASGRQPTYRTISSVEMFMALVEDMVERGTSRSLAYCKLEHIAEAISTVLLQAEALPAAMKRFPNLNA